MLDTQWCVTHGDKSLQTLEPDQRGVQLPLHPGGYNMALKARLMRSSVGLAGGANRRPNRKAHRKAYWPHRNGLCNLRFHILLTVAVYANTSNKAAKTRRFLSLSGLVPSNQKLHRRWAGVFFTASWASFMLELTGSWTHWEVKPGHGSPWHDLTFIQLKIEVVRDGWMMTCYQVCCCLVCLFLLYLL